MAPNEIRPRVKIAAKDFLMRILRAMALLLVAQFTPGCSANKMGSTLADMPTEWGGLPKDAPPRPGSPDYEAWQKQRAIDAASPKSAKR